MALRDSFTGLPVCFYKNVNTVQHFTFEKKSFTFYTVNNWTI